jgi:hypothetical protein
LIKKGLHTPVASTFSIPKNGITTDDRILMALGVRYGYGELFSRVFTMMERFHMLLLILFPFFLRYHHHYILYS